VLTARRREEDPIFAPEVEDIGQVRQLGRSKRLSCPSCGAPVHFRGRPDGQKIWHFAHFQGTDCDLDDPDYRPESREHQLLKWGLRQWLIKKYGAGKAAVESPVETGQIADVLFTSADGRIAFEIQRSELAPETWAERRAGYRSSDVFDEWILVGNSHVSPKGNSETGESQSFDLTPLARSILSETGRLLWIDGETVERLKENGQGSSLPDEIKIWALEGIAGHYNRAEGNPGPYVAALRERPFPKRPSRLLNTRSWKEEVEGAPLLVNGRVYLKRSITGRFSLPDFQVSGESSPAALVSPIASPADLQFAWRWEEANRQWIKEVEKEKCRREEKKQEAENWTSRKHSEATNNLLAKVGEAALSGLSDLLPAVTVLKKKAESAPPDRIRSNPHLQEGLRKWPVRCWTPLADLDVPMSWIFGCDRRLWQIRVYCTQFYHHYAKEYRSKRDIKGNRYDYIPTGYALKSLAQMELLEDGDEISSHLESINKQVDEVLMTSDAAFLEWMEDYFVELHAVRHLVMVAYFEKLCSFGMLSRNHLETQAGPDVTGAHLVRDALVDACDLFRWVRKRCSAPKAFLSRLGRRWLGLARICSGASDNSYKLNAPFHPPYYKEEEYRQIERAIEEGGLQVREDGIYEETGEVITELQWK